MTQTVPLGTVQVKLWLALLVPSDADTVVAYGLPEGAVLETVPEINPVVELIDSPVGKPVAL
jgi:hypothetical protein